MDAALVFLQSAKRWDGEEDRHKAMRIARKTYKAVRRPLGRIKFTDKEKDAIDKRLNKLKAELEGG